VLAEPITGWIGAGTLLIVTSVILVLQGGVAGKATRPEDRIPRLFLAGGRAPRA